MTELRGAGRACKRIFGAGIRDGVIHGAAVVAGGPDGETFSGAWGWADPAHARPMTTRTVVDVASVTKAAAGVTAFLVAHARGLPRTAGGTAGLFAVPLRVDRADGALRRAAAAVRRRPHDALRRLRPGQGRPLQGDRRFAVSPPPL